MSTSKQASVKSTHEDRATPTDAAHRQQHEDPQEKEETGDERLPKAKSHTAEKQGKGVDETGKDSRAPHIEK
ncbi:MAG: hypothetical protein WBQ60_11640 [Asticcacaulis sp.]